MAERDDKRPDTGAATLPAGSGLASEPVSGFDATVAPTTQQTVATMSGSVAGPVGGSIDEPKVPSVVLSVAVGSAVKHARSATAEAVEKVALVSGLEATVSPGGRGGSDDVADLPLVDSANYTILEEFARGGLGRIIRARDERTGRIVAIKEVIGNAEEISRRFCREARVTANLQHPAIVPVYELGRWPTGEPFYAMKLVTGQSLQDVIKATKTLAERMSRLSVVTAVADALAYAHGQGVIHRDLKPANVLVGEFGETVVIDWGLAKVIGATEQVSLVAIDRSAKADATLAGSVLGTPSYMPPEQAAGGDADERADVYAIGAMLYQLISGVAPFTDRSPTNIAHLLAMVEHDAATPISQLEPSTPPELVTIITKAMSRERAGRYPTALELADDLRRFTNGQLVQAHRYDRRTLFKRWVRKNRAAVTVGGALLTVLLVGGVVSVRRILDERDTAEASTAEAVRARDDARDQTVKARASLAIALFQKGRSAEQHHRWRDAAIYYAAARVQEDSDTRKWYAGLAEARAIVPVSQHTGHTDAINAAAISRDGTRVVTVDAAGAMRLWRRTNGSLLAELKLGEALSAVAFSPDGREIAVGSDSGVIRTYNTKHGSALHPVGELKGHAKRVWALAYSPDGGSIASGGEDTTVRLWALGPNTSRVLQGKPGHTQRVYAVEFSPDGKRLASGGDDRALWMWDVTAGTGVLHGSHGNGGIRTVRFARSGERVLTAGWDFHVQIWPLDPKQERAIGWEDSMSVHGAVLSPDERVVVTAGDTGELRFWEVSTKRLVTEIAMPGGRTNSVVSTPDGRWLVTAGAERVPVVWDLGALPRLVDAVGHRGGVHELSITSDGKRLVTVSDDSTIRIWDLADGKEQLRVPIDRYCASPHVAGDVLAAGCIDNTVQRWDLRGRELGRHPTKQYLRRGSLAPDDKLIALGHMKGHLALVEMATGKLVKEGVLHAHQIYGVHFGRNNLLATASLDNRVKVWRTPELTLVREFAAETEDGTLATAIDPFGKLVAGGSQDGSFDVWRIDTGERLAHTKDHRGGIWGVVFSPDGRTIYTGAEDGLILIWDATTWKQIGKLDAKETSVLAIAVSPDGNTLVSGHRSNAIVVWDLTTRVPRYRLGGNAREHSRCNDISQQRWVDDAHRKIVLDACNAQPAAYLTRIQGVTKLRLDRDIDVAPAW